MKFITFLMFGSIPPHMGWISLTPGQIPTQGEIDAMWDSAWATKGLAATPCYFSFLLNGVFHFNASGSATVKPFLNRVCMWEFWFFIARMYTANFIVLLCAVLDWNLLLKVNAAVFSQTDEGMYMEGMIAKGSTNENTNTCGYEVGS